MVCVAFVGGGYVSRVALKGSKHGLAHDVFNSVPVLHFDGVYRFVRHVMSARANAECRAGDIVVARVVRFIVVSAAQYD